MSISLDPETQGLPIPLATTAAWLVIPPLAVNIPLAACIPCISSGEVSTLTKIVSSFNRILFKNHPAVSINKFGNLNSNIVVVNDNIYKLFENTSIVIGTASGTSLEAVAWGVSVIIIASQDNLTANPLLKYGQAKIWDIAFTKDDVKRLYNNLIKYRQNNIDEIKSIASWYKDNLFIEPTEENIVNAFELDKE